MCETKSVTLYKTSRTHPPQSSIAQRSPLHLSNQDVPQVCSQKVANKAFGEPIVHGAHDVAGKFPTLRGGVFSPCFNVRCLNHFSHALIPDVQNFVPQIPPANRPWISNHASDHTSKVDIKFDLVGIVDALGPSSKPSDWCHDGIEEL